MKMNVYDPSPSDVAAWVQLGIPTPWPDQDWDMYVCNGLNDDLILAYANDPSCIQREFFVHCLYQLVGDFTAWSTGNTVLGARIEELLANVDAKSHEDVSKWRDETIALRGGELSFDLNYWVHHLYADQIPDGR
ncbi:hypothetical protein [Rubripirellula reticaptiva]|nr:hypothetical protein [Rubripirellula reticaptiva]